ncbi:hypothetical protein IWQ62_000481 [Dispira parvispora]|uniref:Uncharacterized protein n=1 Tax=Dispira parvispora TaxID=1520584 RepID=A0A9W8E9L2_9FUNG|nr:hypothetical protein IWQ62_000481 [Dispira parvispora]
MESRFSQCVSDCLAQPPPPTFSIPPATFTSLQTAAVDLYQNTRHDNPFRDPNSVQKAWISVFQFAMVATCQLVVRICESSDFTNPFGRAVFMVDVIQCFHHTVTTSISEALELLENRNITHQDLLSTDRLQSLNTNLEIVSNWFIAIQATCTMNTGTETLLLGQAFGHAHVKAHTWFDQFTNAFLRVAVPVLSAGPELEAKNLNPALSSNTLLAQRLPQCYRYTLTMIKTVGTLFRISHAVEAESKDSTNPQLIHNAAELCQIYFFAAQKHQDDLKCVGATCKQIMVFCELCPYPAFRKRFSTLEFLEFIHRGYLRNADMMHPALVERYPHMTPGDRKKLVNRYLTIAKFYLSLALTTAKISVKLWQDGETDESTPGRVYTLMCGFIQRTSPVLLRRVGVPDEAVQASDDQVNTPLLSELITTLAGVPSLTSSPEEYQHHREWLRRVFLGKDSLQPTTDPETNWANFTLRQTLLAQRGLLHTNLASVLLERPTSQGLSLWQSHLLSIDWNFWIVGQDPQSTRTFLMLLTPLWTFVSQTSEQQFPELERQLVQVLVLSTGPAAAMVSELFTLLVPHLSLPVVKSQITVFLRLGSLLLDHPVDVVVTRLTALVQAMVLALPEATAADLCSQVVRDHLSTLQSQALDDTSFVTWLITNPPLWLVLYPTASAHCPGLLDTYRQRLLHYTTHTLEPYLQSHFTPGQNSVPDLMALTIPCTHLLYLYAHDTYRPPDFIPQVAAPIIKLVTRVLTLVTPVGRGSPMNPFSPPVQQAICRLLDTLFRLSMVLLPLPLDCVTPLLQAIRQITERFPSSQIPMISLLHFIGQCAIIPVHSQDEQHALGAMLGPLFALGGGSSEWTVVQKTLDQVVHYATSASNVDMLGQIVPGTLEDLMFQYINQQPFVQDLPADYVGENAPAETGRFYIELACAAYSTKLPHSQVSIRSLTDQRDQRVQQGQKSRSTFHQPSPSGVQPRRPVAGGNNPPMNGFHPPVPTSAAPHAVNTRVLRRHPSDPAAMDKSSSPHQIIQTLLTQRKFSIGEHQTNVESVRMYMHKLKTESARFDPQLRQNLAQVWSIVDTILNES